MIMIKKIAFFGATGMLAQPVIKELSSQNFEIKALVRDLKKAKAMLPQGIQLIEGDLKNSSAIERVVKGSDAIYINLSVNPNSKKSDFQSEREGLQHILTAAQNTNLQCISIISSLVQRYQGSEGFSWWVFDIKINAVNAIKKSGIPYLIFYPSGFMENFDKGPHRLAKLIVLAGKSRHPIYFVAGKDYSKQVCNAFKNFDGKSSEFVIQGPEAYTAGEAAKIFVSHYKKEKMKLIRLPFAAIALARKFSTNANYGYHIVKALNNYPEKFEAKNTWEKLGKPETTIIGYATSALNI